MQRALKKHEKRLNGANIYIVNGGIQAELKETGNNLTDENRGIKKGQDDKGLGSALREVRSSGGRNL